MAPRLGIGLPLWMACLLACLTLCDGARASAARRGEPAIEDSEVRELVRLVNDHRAAIGCSPLRWHPRLAAVASRHSEDMARRGFFGHVSPDGEGPFDRIQDALIEYRAAAENIAAGHRRASEVFPAWMKSRRHRANLEDQRYTHHGVARFENRWTHVFVALAPTSP